MEKLRVLKQIINISEKSFMLRFVSLIGVSFLGVCTFVGNLAVFFFNSVKSLFCKWYVREVYHQFFSIGFFSIPVVAMTAVFSGMVLALQTYSGFADLADESSIAKVLAIGIARELGPVMTGLMFAGRVSSSIAAELGTMVVTEQVDALKTMNVNVFRFLVAPRVLGAVLAMPVLIFIADSLGVLGGVWVSVGSLDLSKMILLDNIMNYLTNFDLLVGLVKTLSFGVATTLFGCYYGLSATIGSKAVGNATTKSVVASCITVLVLNYLLTWAFF